MSEEWRAKSAGDAAMSVFRDEVYELTQAIPKGKVATYAEVARALECKSFRAVGQALRRNPYAPVVPCHRVIASDLSLGGFMGAKDQASTELRRKVALLGEEGVKFDPKGRLVDKGKLYAFTAADVSTARLRAADRGAARPRGRGSKRDAEGGAAAGGGAKRARAEGFAKPEDLRKACREGVFSDTTAGHCMGYVQANLVVLPEAYADEFREYCRRNPQPCPLLDETRPGSRAPQRLAPATTDLASDLPKYRVFRDGELEAVVQDVRDRWDAEHMVGFLIGCSFSFEEALARAGVPLRHVEERKTVPMYVTNIDTTPAGRFSGKMVVSMRPVHKSLVDKVRTITAAFPRVHGAPVHVGDPAAIGIRDIAKPDHGDAVTILPDEVPVFHACGITPQIAVRAAKPPLCITHFPGAMFVGDVRNDEI